MSSSLLKTPILFQAFLVTNGESASVTFKVKVGSVLPVWVSVSEAFLGAVQFEVQTLQLQELMARAVFFTNISVMIERVGFVMRCCSHLQPFYMLYIHFLSTNIVTSVRSYLISNVTIFQISQKQNTPQCSVSSCSPPSPTQFI